MSRSAEDVENYLLKLGRTYERAPGWTPANGTFLLRAGSGTLVAVSVSPPIATVHVEIGPTPQDEKHRLRLFTKLLQLNATDLMYASYGIEDGKVSLSAALLLDSLDANELEAALADIDVALARHTADLVDAARE
ncbi:MAG: hypothetical protein HOV80_25775 [Polyangiaceae bacterium]|nr:hypothetical protein [Polyangiaceae bacterium]